MHHLRSRHFGLLASWIDWTLAPMMEHPAATTAPPYHLPLYPRTSTQLLTQERALQHGSDTVTAITLMPSIRIDGVQYRGRRDDAGVTRALCAAFPLGREPALCNDEAVSEDECRPGGEGYVRCRMGWVPGGSV